MAITKRSRGKRPTTIDQRRARGIEGGATLTRETQAGKKTRRCPRCLAVQPLIFTCSITSCPVEFATLTPEDLARAGVQNAGLES
jgi:hypothetical protein